MNLGTRSTQKLVEMHNGQSIFLLKFWLICLYVNVVFVFIYHLIQLWVITCPLPFYCLLLDLFFVTYRLQYTIHKIRVGKPTNHDIKFICCRSSFVPVVVLGWFPKWVSWDSSFSLSMFPLIYLAQSCSFCVDDAKFLIFITLIAH